MAITKIGTPELFDFSATNTALQLPTGDTASRPATPSTGEWRFNSQLKYVEYYDGGEWRQIDTESAAVFTPSENFNTNTYFGNGATQAIDAKFNEAANFNGSSSKINISGSPFNLTTYSLSFWINANDYNQSSTSVVNIGLDDTGGAWGGLAFGVNANKVYYFGGDFAGVGGSGFFTQTGTTNITNGVWYNVVMIVNGTSITGYINGVQDTGLSRTLGANITYKSGALNTLGLRQGGFGDFGYWKGKIDQVRIFNTAITAANVSTLYAETTTTAATLDFPSGAGCIAAYQLDGNGNDISSAQTTTSTATYQFNNNLNSIGGSNNGSVSSGSASYTTGVFGQAADFGSWNVSVPNLAATLQNTALSFSFWATAGNSTSYYLMSAGSSGSTRKGFLIGTANGTINIRFNNFGTTYFDINASMPSGFNHYVCTFDNTTNTNGAKIYVNGVLTTQGTSTGLNNFTFSTSTFFIGSEPTDSGQGPSYNSSNLDQLRIFTSAVNQAQVTALYNETVATSSSASISYQAGTYDGTTNNIGYTGLQFQPDLVWIKVRNQENNNVFTDSVRGVDSIVSSDGANGELVFDLNWRNQYGQIQSFDTNGFTIKNSTDSNVFNKSGDTYVAWNWKAAASTTTIAASGNRIASKVRANVEAGFSITEYTSTSVGVNTLVECGIDTPELIIIKCTSTNSTNWIVAAPTLLGSTNFYLSLNDGNARVNNGSPWLTISNTTFALPQTFGNANANGRTYIAYSFKSIAGYQKIGIYGGGSTNVISTSIGGDAGFEPRFLMVKNINTDGRFWYIFDAARNPSNPRDLTLFANSSVAEAVEGSPYKPSFVAGGFSWPTTGGGGVNQSGDNYLFLAIA